MACWAACVRFSWCACSIRTPDRSPRPALAVHLDCSGRLKMDIEFSYYNLTLRELVDMGKEIHVRPYTIVLSGHGFAGMCAAARRAWLAALAYRRWLLLAPRHTVVPCSCCPLSVLHMPSPPPPLQWIEWGIGGGVAQTGDQPARTALEAAHTPYFGEPHGI